MRQIIRKGSVSVSRGRTRQGLSWVFSFKISMRSSDVVDSHSCCFRSFTSASRASAWEVVMLSTPTHVGGVPVPQEGGSAIPSPAAVGAFCSQNIQVIKSCAKQSPFTCAHAIGARGMLTFMDMRLLCHTHAWIEETSSHRLSLPQTCADRHKVREAFWISTYSGDAWRSAMQCSVVEYLHTTCLHS